MKECKIENYLREKVNNDIFSGCSLIFGKPFEIIFEAHIGNLSFNSSNKVNKQTTYDLQSMTKSVITSPIFMKLTESGILNPFDPLGFHIPEILKVNPSLAEIPLINLANHSSGLSDVDIEGTFDSPVQLWEHMIEAIPRFIPGRSVEYSDLGYRLLGKALERATDSSLEILGHELLWKPLRMKHTGFIPTNPFNIASTPDSNGACDDEQVRLLGNVLGCDGIFSTANDLFLFASVLLNRDLFSPNGYLALQTRAHHATKLPTNYFETLTFGTKTVGWEINELWSYAGNFWNENCLEKAGGAGTFMWLDQSSGYIFIYLTNHGKPKPFDSKNWNDLVDRIGPKALSNLIYDELYL